MKPRKSTVDGKSLILKAPGDGRRKVAGQPVQVMTIPMPKRSKPNTAVSFSPKSTPDRSLAGKAISFS
jgi:hypothetical protein